MEKQFFMVYAEGQGAPTYKHENEQAASKEAERLAEKLGVNTTVLQAVKTVAPKDITKRVKTYADACAVLGIEPMNETVLAKLGFTKDEITYRKLKTIAEALNEGWRPDWANSKEYKYWPWFVYNPAHAGFSCAYALRGFDYACEYRLPALLFTRLKRHATERINKEGLITAGFRISPN